MPISKTKMKNAAIAAKSAALQSAPKELLDQFVSGPMTGDAINAASMAFKKALSTPSRQTLDDCFAISAKTALGRKRWF